MKNKQHTRAVMAPQETNFIVSKTVQIVHHTCAPVKQQTLGIPSRPRVTGVDRFASTSSNNQDILRNKRTQDITITSFDKSTALWPTQNSPLTSTTHTNIGAKTLFLASHKCAEPISLANPSQCSLRPPRITIPDIARGTHTTTPSASHLRLVTAS